MTGITPAFITEREALALHDMLLAAHGGAQGVRDQGLLQSALARPRNMLAYGEVPDLVAMAGACTFGVVKNHPFVDGNKRVGFVVGVLFLELNGYRFTATEPAAAEAVLALAAGALDESGYVAFLRENIVAEPGVQA